MAGHLQASVAQFEMHKIVASPVSPTATATHMLKHAHNTHTRTLWFTGAGFE